MASKKFESLTTEEKYKTLRNRYYAFTGAKWASIVAPFGVIAGLNWETYFTETNGFKMASGMIICLGVALYAVYGEMKKGKGEVTQRISGVLGWGIATVLVWLFSSILNDLLLIMSCGFGGQLIGALFGLGASYNKELSDKYRSANINASAFAEANKTSSTSSSNVNIGDILG